MDICSGPVLAFTLMLTNYVIYIDIRLFVEKLKTYNFFKDFDIRTYAYKISLESL